MLPKWIYIGLALLLSGCQPIDNSRPPDGGDVYEARDSIRQLMLLRMGEALQEINRQSERMRRKAYSVDARQAERLRATADQIERDYKKIEARIQRLENDSVLGDWYQQLHQMEVELLNVSRTLGVSL